MQHYLSKKKYSVGKIGTLKYVDSLDNFNNVKASMAAAYALVPVLKPPKALSFLPTKGIDASIPASTINNMVIAVANTGATNHMCSKHSAFMSYHPSLITH